MGGTGTRTTAPSQTREARVARGTAQARTGLPPRNRAVTPAYPTYFSSGYYDPWYSTPRYGHVGLYSPWSYEAGVWGWGGYSYSYGYRHWHDPYLYGPSYYGAFPYYWNQPQYDIPRTGREERDDPPTGALRLKVTPREAKVYVDGALAGSVDEFDGLTNHLRLPAGRYQIEFRADGYETRLMEVVVEEGKTRTERTRLTPR